MPKNFITKREPSQTKSIFNKGGQVYMLARERKKKKNYSNHQVRHSLPRRYVNMSPFG